MQGEIRKLTMAELNDVSGAVCRQPIGTPPDGLQWVACQYRESDLKADLLQNIYCWVPGT